MQRIDDPDIQFVISERCLDTYPSLAASHFLADYLTTYFNQHLTVMRQNEIQALYVGSKVSSRKQFQELAAQLLFSTLELQVLFSVGQDTVLLCLLFQGIADSS